MTSLMFNCHVWWPNALVSNTIRSSASSLIPVAPRHKSSNPVPLGKLRFRAKLNFSISPTLENFLFNYVLFEKIKIAKYFSGIRRLSSLFILIWYSRGSDNYAVWFVMNQRQKSEDYLRFLSWFGTLGKWG
jgi:hypothetical protein